MTITGSALTALFLGMAWALIRTVEFLISRRSIKNGNGNGKAHSAKEQEQLLEDIYSLTNEMYKLHVVFDENHVPLWYVPRETVKQIRDVNEHIVVTAKDIAGIKSGQTLMVEKVLELIVSQKILLDRLSDLIIKMDRFINK